MKIYTLQRAKLQIFLRNNNKISCVSLSMFLSVSSQKCRLCFSQSYASSFLSAYSSILFFDEEPGRVFRSIPINFIYVKVSQDANGLVDAGEQCRRRTAPSYQMNTPGCFSPNSMKTLLTRSLHLEASICLLSNPVP